MTRWALALVLVLLAPSVALAREPVISYVDETGDFRLYDEEAETEIVLPVPANFLGFRYGISLNGRYIVFNDDPPERNLHLLDRATNTEIPLPGINVYTNPQGLTVSDNGLIGFDNQSNGPAVVYNSATGSFVDTGFLATNGHRQTRLSGDGRLLATTCISDCVEDPGGDTDAYVQDLGTKLNTVFPDDNAAGEEHPCVDGDGSLVGIDKLRSAMNAATDIFLYDRSVTPPAAVPVTGAMEQNTNEVSCVLDAGGEYLGFFNNDTVVFKVIQISDLSPVALPPGAEFDNFSQFSAPYTPPAPPPPPPPPPCCEPAPDVTKPVARAFGMTKKRFRARRGATRFHFRLSEAADIRIAIRRRGRRVGVLRRDDRPAGPNAIAFNGRFRGSALRPGRYVAVLTATDAAGNVSPSRSVRFTVLRAAGDRRP